MNLKRRTFLKLTSTTAAGLPLVSIGLSGGCKPASQGTTVQELYALFKEPQNIHRPFVRWWWNGNRLSHQEILRELDLLKQAGIGGVEINPIKFPETADPIGIKECDWLSDEWLGYLRTALHGAKERDIVCDIIVGSGWPFGGAFLTREEQTQMVTIGTRNVKGPAVLHIPRQELLDAVNPEIHSPNEKKYKDLFMLRLAPAAMDAFEPGIDLDAEIGKETLTVPVPPGEHVLYFLVKMTGYMAVINGAPGAKGPVLNHFSDKAVSVFLQRMSDKLNQKIGKPGTYFRAMFTDSIELEGANWCEDFLPQFEKRQGYSLRPYLPYVLFKVGEMGNAVKEAYGSTFSESANNEIQRVRYDFYITHIELFKERFSDTFHAWCRKQGVQSRVQAYGMEYHPMEASMDVDIPECETWLGASVGGDMPDYEYGDGRAYSMSNKYVSSGARLAGKKIVSCEEITNTSMVFNATLEIIKIGGDQSNLSGVTHSILHGFNYGPAEATFPGWIRYGTFINERNPWWPYFRLWTDYKARLSAVFQNAELMSNIAIMHPLADMWMKYGTQRDPYPATVYPSYVHNVWEAIHQNGSGCDIISENILQHAVFDNGSISYGSRNYRTLLLIEVESMEPETAEAIKRFAEAGGLVIFVGKEPCRSAGFLNHEQKDKTVAETIAALKKSCPQRAVVHPAPTGSILAWYKDLQSRYAIEPYVRFGEPAVMISQVYYRTKDLDIFFIANSSLEKSVRQKIEFDVKGKTPWLWDAETGQRCIYPSEGDGRILDVELAPAGSLLIVFSNENKGELLHRLPLAGTAKMLAGPWQVTLNHSDGSSRVIELDALVDFNEKADLKAFAGKAIYRLTFTVDQPDAFHLLDLGKVCDLSQVRLNNKPLGLCWHGRHVYELAGALVAGTNELEVVVTKCLGNYCKSLTENKTAQVWTKRQPWHPSGLLGPVKLA
jgi:hypothetical protein